MATTGESEKDFVANVSMSSAPRLPDIGIHGDV